MSPRSRQDPGFPGMNCLKIGKKLSGSDKADIGYARRVIG